MTTDQLKSLGGGKMSDFSSHVKISAYLEEDGEDAASTLGLSIDMTGISRHQVMADMLRSVAKAVEEGALHDPSLSDREIAREWDDETKNWVARES